MAAASVKNLGSRVGELISLADKTIASKRMSTNNNHRTTASVDFPLFIEFRSASLSFILNLYGKDHPYYTGFTANVHFSHPEDVEAGKGYLNSIKAEIDGCWLTTMKGLVSSELFSDFLEMAEHLLSQKYKDAAAVIIGSVLEEHLRQLCLKNGLEVEVVEEKTGRVIPKKTESLNAQLCISGIYGKMDQKSVTAWLALRNNAAHGKYAEYGDDQVALFLQSIRDFITRNSI